ncbi:MAG: hypothetical protein AMXMBFR47_45190 [Planctomycetota bacterium]
MTSLVSALAQLDGLSAGVLYWVGQALVYGSALALLTWLVTSLALRRVRPAVHAAFWVIVLVKFIVPIGPEFSYSLSSLISACSPIALVPQSPPPAVQPLPSPAGGGEWIVYAVPFAAPVEAAAAPTNAARVPVFTLITLAYLAGLVLVAGLRIGAYIRFARRCTQLEPASAEVASQVARIAHGAGVYQSPRVRISDTASAPFVFGALRPTLVLARRHLDRPAEFEAVVLHEIAHLRRGDLLVRYLQWLAGTVLYFWPVVAWVNRRIDLAREHACDEWALRRGALSPAQYARCLLDCVQRTRPRLAAYAPASMAARASHVQRRIEMILNTTDSPRAGRWVKIVAGATLIGWTGFALSGASAAALKSDARKKMRPAPQASAMPAADAQTSSIRIDPIAETPVEGAPIRIALHMTTNGGDGEATATLETAQLVLIGGDHLVEAGPRPPMQFLAFQHAHAGPGLDIDGDGNVTPEEHDAFVVAKAMANPEAVLAQYPDADTDLDGVLSADEAAELVGGPFTAPLPPPPPGPGVFTVSPKVSEGGEMEIVFEVQGEEAAPAMTMIAQRIAIQPQTLELTVESTADEPGVWVTTTTAAEGCVDAQVETSPPVEVMGVPLLSDIPIIGNLFRMESTEPETEVVGPIPTLDRVATARSVAGQPMLLTRALVAEPALPPAAWIMSNIDAQPAKEDIAAQVDRTQAAAMRRFLKMHPKSDRNEDGVLTVDERDAYVDKMQSTTRERYLNANPEADTNEDGILTPAEMRAHQRSQREVRAEARGAVRVHSLTVPTGPGGAIEARPVEENDGPK